MWASLGAGGGREGGQAWPHPDLSPWKPEHQNCEITICVVCSRQFAEVGHGGHRTPTSVARTPMRGWSAERPALGA